MKRESVPAFLVSVQGLKKSGKTTVIEGLIASLLARGFQVGSIKTTHHPRMSLDLKGTDTYRHVRAGAEFVIAHSGEETVFIERHRSKKELKEIIRLFPPNIQFILCEGSSEPEIPSFIVCLKSMAQMEETVKLRQIPSKRIIALSGVVALSSESHAPYPLFDILNPVHREALTSLLIEKAGNPLPAGIPRGPLKEDPYWHPGEISER